MLASTLSLKNERKNMLRHYMITAMAICLAAVSGMVNALEPIASITQFEKNMETCLKEDKAPITCLNALITKHHEQGLVYANQIEDLTNIVKQWLGEKSVVELHLVKSTDFGNVIFRRVYLIEDSIGRLMMANITYQKTKGILQLRDVQFTNKSESLDRLFENNY